jgi:hypothetical protein
MMGDARKGKKCQQYYPVFLTIPAGMHCRNMSRAFFLRAPVRIRNAGYTVCQYNPVNRKILLKPAAYPARSRTGGIFYVRSAQMEEHAAFNRKTAR